MPLHEIQQPLEIAERVAAVIRARECACWIGSGLSVAYPAWDELLDILCDDCGVDRLEGDARQSSKELQAKADECKEANGPKYRETLEEVFTAPKISIHTAINPLLRLPFNCFVTTNFDPQLSKTGADLGRTDCRSYPDGLQTTAIGSAIPPIYYLHGHASKGGETLVLAKSEFDEAYEDIIPLFLGQLFQSCDVVFMGAKLAEEGFDRVFEQLARARRRSQRIGYEIPERDRLILIGVPPSRDLEETGRGYVEQGVTPLFYDSSNDFVQLLEIIDGVRDLVGFVDMEVATATGAAL